jgi:polyisoprenoid-binding protein YceI
MKRIFVLSLIVFAGLSVQAGDKIFTKKGKISFYSETAAEKIEAHNNRVTSVYEISTGKLEFSVLVNAFQFEKALMQEHFNENYMESAKYPKATFVGKVTSASTIDLKKDGVYEVKADGDLTIHGVTKPISVNGKFTVAGGKVSASSEFEVNLKDYNVKFPSAVSEIIKLVVAINYEPMKK